MTERKTLKDFDWMGQDMTYDDDIIKTDLRQEAIKWIKSKENNGELWDYPEPEDFIKHFFNITDEELK